MWIFFVGVYIMKKGNIFLRTILSTVAATLGLAVSSSAQSEEPAVERDTVLMDPLYFVVDGSAVNDENENQRLWNELMKYKLWGTDSVIFNKGGFRIAEPSGYTGTAKGKVMFYNGGHTLGGPIISGNDLDFGYYGGGADGDTLLKGPVRAGWLTLTNWYDAPNAKYEGIYCFEGQIYFPGPDRFTNPNRNENEHREGDAVDVTKRFIANVHKGGGKIYADWDKDMPVPGSSDVIVPGLPDLFNNDGTGLDGHFKDCPKDEVPEPEKKLSVPAIKTVSSWDPAIDVSSNAGKIIFVHVPPITAEDLKQSPKKVWYDKYVENVKAGGSKGEIIYVLMPSNKHNANKKTGRLTRIFSRDGFNFENSANDMKIQVAIVKDNATWDETAQMWKNLNEPEYNEHGLPLEIENEDKPYWIRGTGEWKNLDKINITPVADSNYAGNLLFYTTAPVDWKPFTGTDGDKSVGAKFQGTFITTDNFFIADHLSIAGQLIAGKKLRFESDFDGEFHYVPFNAAEIKSNIFSSDTFKEKDNYWYPMNFYLTDTAHTEVSFDYCLAFFGGNPGEVAIPGSMAGLSFADKDDLAFGAVDSEGNTHPMPLCSKNETGHVVIAKNTRVPTAATMPYISVRRDSTIEEDEYMLFKITNLNGATISGGRFDGGLLVKLIDDDNKPPHFIDLDKTKLVVPENTTKAKAGTIKAEDDEGDSFTYEITGGTAEDLFDIGLTSGVVTMKNGVEPFDYEEWAESKTSYTLKVEVCDTRAGSFNTLLCTQATFKVSVGDVNETPYFTNVSNTIEIAENASLSSNKVSSEDTDSKTYTQDTKFLSDEYAIIDGDSDIFEITSTGYIKPKVVLDYETKSEYEIKVRVRDANRDSDKNLLYPDLYEDRVFKVVVTDVEDGPKFEYVAYNGTINENSVNPDTVKLDHKIKATTSQVGATITYSLVDESKTFEIDPSTGVITVAKNAVLDYETKNTYTMTVIASDNGKVVQTDKAAVTITLNDVNEKPIFVEPTKTLTFPENEKGYVIGSLTFDDLDTATKFRNNKFKLLNNEKDFILDEDTGVLTTARKFDYETEEKTYELNILIYDASGDDNLTATGTIVVELTNINEPPFLTKTEFTVPESDPVGTALKENLEADDIDGPDTKFNFFILDGDEEVSATKEFKLDSKTGVFTVASPLDFEKKESYSIKIRVRDEHDGFSDSTVTIKVIDVNEAPSIVVDTIYVKEDQKINDPFSTVKTDKDDPDIKNADFRNNVYENTDNNETFKVNPNGDVILLKTVDYESDSIYSIMVRVTDKDDKNLTSTKKVVVKVLDVYEKSVVKITRVSDKDSVYLNPDSVFVNQPYVDVEWLADDKTKTSTDSLKPGCNVITKTYKDPTKNDPGSASVVVCYSDAAPIVTISANGDNVSADNIYTVVEKATKNDTAIYVNEKKNDIKVTVKDTAANVSKSFTVNLVLDTVSYSEDIFKNIKSVADAKISRKDKSSSEVSTTSENGNTIKNTYTETVNGVTATVTYYTDKKGNDIKRSVITSSGKTEEIAVIEVSYTATKLDGTKVTISYFADASTGERVTLKTGLTESESVLSADGDDIVGTYKVSYTYTDKNNNAVNVSYYLDEKGKIAKNKEGNIGYNVGYTYVNKFGNSSYKEVFIVLDQKGPVVKIESPSEGEVLTATFVEVKWTVNGVEQDTLRVQGLEKGSNTIVRVFRDKAGNESSDTVNVMVKNVKNINIDVEKPVTLVSLDSVQKYYDKNPPKDNQSYTVSFFNYKKDVESVEIVGIKGKATEGSGDELYPGLDGHLGPTLVVDARVPVVNAVGGLATLDDIVSANGMIALEGVDAANGTKIPVSEYVDKYCTDEFKKSMTSDYSRMNLYWTTIRVNVWVYTNLGSFIEKYTYDYDLDDPDYVSSAGHIKTFFEMTPDKNGDVRTKKGRLLGTGAYLFKTEVKMTSKLRCTLPPVSQDEANRKKNAVIKSSDELLKSFGYRRPVNK